MKQELLRYSLNFPSFQFPPYLFIYPLENSHVTQTDGRWMVQMIYINPFQLGWFCRFLCLSASKQLMWRFHRGVASPHEAMTFHLLSSPDFPCFPRSLGHAWVRTKKNQMVGWGKFGNHFQIFKKTRMRLEVDWLIVVIITMVSDTKNKTFQNHICFCFKGLFGLMWNFLAPSYTCSQYNSIRMLAFWITCKYTMIIKA